MKGNDKECSCETCRQREKLEIEFPEKEIGLQYAVWDLEKFRLIVSAEELPYLQEELKDKSLERLNEENVQYILANGVFKSQTEFHEDFFDLKLSKMGTYFYFDSEKEQCFEVKIIDYSLLAEQEDEAKVCLLLKANDFLPFPKNQGELSVTLSMTMSELGNTIKDLVFSRIEFGFFRLDSGKIIDKEKIGRWKKQISSKKCFEVPFKRFLVIEPEETD
ncbi:hypothetical protein [Lactococcus lactis]|uniref:hypothetical protein n=1 Tax=Lactococcus lactis TaxID=1358 RepID=UPI0015C2E4C8|nr:hypothetical protein [Lactococcus lactis]QLF91662.1 hypothetical protein HPC60_13725 [Lactococcus lactis subsp. lactis]